MRNEPILLCVNLKNLMVLNKKKYTHTHPSGFYVASGGTCAENTGVGLLIVGFNNGNENKDKLQQITRQEN
ncbi:hypothetical protein ACQP3L_40030, partial [Escherichia coli]